MARDELKRPLATLVALLAMAALVRAAERHWQTGTWGESSTERRMIDFGPGRSGFGPPTPTMRAVADVRTFVIETDALRFELSDTVSVGRRSFEITVGTPVVFAVDKSTVYIRDSAGIERKLRLVKKTPKPRAAASTAVYTALGGGHLLRAVTGAGEFLTLEDGSVWQVDPKARFQTRQWEPGAGISVRRADGENGFAYELQNIDADEGAAARYVPAR